jgi:hypothetical protein
MDTEQLLERLAANEEAGAAPGRAPARLKSKIYSALIERLAEDGPLRPLRAVRADGGHLCVFEHAVAALPVGNDVSAWNPCRVCHARILGERLDRAPIFWPGCPYSEFHHG